MPFSTAALSPQAWLCLAPHKSRGSHCDMCVYICAWCVCMTTRIERCSLLLSLYGRPWLPPPTHTHTHTLSIATQTRAVMAVEKVTVGSWATMPWQPSLNLLSTSSPLFLCCDSHHNSCCLWTCQAAKDTKTTESTFDIRSCYQKTRDKLSWQLC